MTSGLGNRYGGIGVVAELIRETLAPIVETTVWTNTLEAPRLARASRLVAATMAAIPARPSFIFYDHMNLARLSRVLPWLHGVPYGVFLHGTEVWRSLDPLHRSALKRARLLVTNSKFTADVARRHNPWLPPVEVAWLGVRAPRTPVVVDERPPSAVIVGRMDPSERQKGHDPILDCWNEIRAHVPDAELQIIGDGGDKARLEERARALRLAGVRFRGRLDDAQRNDAYVSSRLFLFPSVQEGFGLAAVEGAVHGCALLGVRGTVLEELFPSGSGAVFAADASAGEIGRCAIALLGDPTQGQELGARARQHAEALYLEDHFKERFRRAVEPLLRIGHGRARLS